MFDFMWIQCACILIVLFVPSISLWLPTTLTERATIERMAPSSETDAAIESAQGEVSYEDEYTSDMSKGDALEEEYGGEPPKRGNTDKEEQTKAKK
jgi:hypothetical protein